MSKWLVAVLTLLAFAGGLTVYYGISKYDNVIYQVAERAIVHSQKREPAPQSPVPVLFLGDVMLARHVEVLMDRYGANYPFDGLRGLLATAPYAFANFESAIPIVHEPTPSGVMRFSVAERSLEGVASAQVTHVSLANNHALDFGQENYEYSIERLADIGVTAFGHPTRLASSSVTYMTLGSVRVAVLALHTLFVPPDESSLNNTIKEMGTASDLQIVYVHWGTEYEQIHDATQERLARQLASLGVDVIVGHHPHVVQDVARYGDTVVFYSLGNTIFDQYWNDAVREGLIIRLTPEDHILSIELLPISSINSLSSPELMDSLTRSIFLEALAMRSQIELREAVNNGVITSSY